ncbi:hypothetical protein PM082_009025 [Marasmius tenuissimus]|nr:hypothetical protein PM082_009025 [Marasmius tenuissimus]
MNRESDLARRSTEIRKFFRSSVPDKVVVSQFLRDTESELDGYQAEIHRLQTAIYAIESKRDRLRKTAELYKTLLSPIHAMPSEILTIIFKFCCETNVMEPWSLPATLRLTAVCGRWRDITLSTPSLWSSISIEFDDWITSFNILDQLMERYMSKSQNSPLTLALKIPHYAFDFDSDDVDTAAARRVLNTLTRQCHRWRSISLVISPCTFPSSIFQPIRGHLPILKSLSLVRHGDLDSWKGVPFDFFDDCPSLSLLRIDDPFVLGDTEVPLPRGQVRTLRITAPCSVHAFSLLSQYREVETLDLVSIGGEHESDGDYSDHVVASGVKSLRILDVSAQCDVDDALRHAPPLNNLSALTIAGQHFTTAFHWTGVPVQDFVLRSGCTITYLHLQWLPIDDVRVLSLLTSLPALRSLCIVELAQQGRNRIVTRTLLDGLTVDAPMNAPSLMPVLPRLTEMKLVVDAQGLQSQTLLRMLSSRWLPDPVQATELGVDSLSFVAITVLSNITPPERPLDCLRCFKDAGMKLVITYATPAELVGPLRLFPEDTLVW